MTLLSRFYFETTTLVLLTVGTHATVQAGRKQCKTGLGHLKNIQSVRGRHKKRLREGKAEK